MNAVAESFVQMGQSAFSVVVVGGRQAAMTHSELRSVNTSHSVDEHGEGVALVRAPHNPIHVVPCQIEYVMRLSVASTQVELVCPHSLHRTV